MVKIVTSDNLETTIGKRTCFQCGKSYDGTVVRCPRDGFDLFQGPQENLTGTILADQYQILEFLGEGGMGIVYKARCTKTGRTLGVKLLHKHLASDAYSRKRFEREASAASCLMHPNVISVHDFGMTKSGQPFMVQDYLEGVSLDDVLQKEGPQPAQRMVAIFAQVCDALAHAHSRGVIHRDLKPSNIMLMEVAGRKDFVKVVDFGIAKLLPESGQEAIHLTADGETFGSPLYMSPEQCMAQKLDPRSDIYCLGCVIYESLTGKPPIVGTNMLDTMQRHITDTPMSIGLRRPELGPCRRLEAVIFRAMAKQPGDRQGNMLTLKQELLDAVDQDPPALASPVVAEAAPPTVNPRVRAQKLTQRMLAVIKEQRLVFLALVLVLVAIIYLLVEQMKSLNFLDDTTDRIMEDLVRIQRHM